jgi:hypothetical protein
VLEGADLLLRVVLGADGEEQHQLRARAGPRAVHDQRGGDRRARSDERRSGDPVRFGLGGLFLGLPRDGGFSGLGCALRLGERRTSLVQLDLQPHDHEQAAEQRREQTRAQGVQAPVRLALGKILGSHRLHRDRRQAPIGVDVVLVLRLVEREPRGLDVPLVDVAAHGCSAREATPRALIIGG